MRIYVDTSVVGGYFDDDFAVETKQFFDKPRLRNKVEKWENEKFNICLTIVLRACYTESVSKKS